MILMILPQFPSESRKAHDIRCLSILPRCRSSHIWSFPQLTILTEVRQTHCPEPPDGQHQLQPSWLV